MVDSWSCGVKETLRVNFSSPRSSRVLTVCPPMVKGAVVPVSV
jgi:hypothetical protein